MSPFRRLCLALLAPGALLAAAPALAQGGAEPACNSGDFPMHPEFSIATVGAATPRLYFYKDGEGCPEKGASCQTRAFVVAGDRLLVGKNRGAWSCAWYPGKRVETAGWVRNGDLTLQVGPPPADWGGKWKARNSSGVVNIGGRDGAWTVQGKASSGSGAALRLGELGGELKVQGARARLAGTQGAECGADLTRVGDFLIVHDNGQCGGAGVRFDGVYTRIR